MVSCLILLIAVVLSGCEGNPHFYPFGAAVGDAQGQEADDGYDLLMLPEKVKFFSHTYDELYVNTNGIISFGAPYTWYVPESFPLGYKTKHVLAALFWADTDLRLTGKIWYRSTTDPILVARATAEIDANFPDPCFLGNYEPSHLYIITWEDVTYYGASQPYSTNTYQIVFMTNGFQSFVQYHYDTITWISAYSRLASVGLNKRLGLLGWNHPYSMSSLLYNLVSDSNVGVDGMWMYMISKNVVLWGPKCTQLAP